VVEAANARNCDAPVKTRTAWGNRAKETAADTGKPAKDLSDAMFAANCARLASIRINWANKAKGIAVGIARLAEVANPDEIYLTTAAMAHAAARRS
jgi:hypothetical protein